MAKVIEPNPQVDSRGTCARHVPTRRRGRRLAPMLRISKNRSVTTEREHAGWWVLAGHIWDLGGRSFPVWSFFDAPAHSIASATTMEVRSGMMCPNLPSARLDYTREVQRAVYWFWFRVRQAARPLGAPRKTNAYPVSDTEPMSSSGAPMTTSETWSPLKSPVAMVSAK